MKASYRKAIEWIAENDGAGDPEYLDLEHVSRMVTVILVADLFAKDAISVAKAIIIYRKNIFDR